MKNMHSGLIELIEIITEHYKIIKANFIKSIIVTTIATIITTIFIFSIPRHYTANIRLTPDFGSKQGGSLGSLGNAAAMFGINLNGNTNYDAISPAFYPEIIASNDFIIPLMDVQVNTIDETFNGTYAQYLTTAQKSPWWSKIIPGILSIFKNEEEGEEEKTEKKINPFMLSKKEKALINTISSSIYCNVDSKSNTIEITTTAQDPLVAATMANIVKEHLQETITEYRTSKVKKDYEYAVRFCETTHDDYITAQQAYAEFVDKHQGVSRQAYRIEQERLQGEMQLAYSLCDLKSYTQNTFVEQDYFADKRTTD